MKRFCWIFLVLMWVGFGCQSSNQTSAPNTEESQPAFTKIDEQNLPGATRTKYRVETSGREIWLYRPTSKANGIAILIPASSSNGISGGKLSDMDQMLADGFVRLGFSIAAYDVGEAAPLDADSLDDFKRAIHSVIDDGGLSDARNAIAVASMNSTIHRFVALGQGAASSLALRAANNEVRVGGCVMIDPPKSIKSGSTENVIDLLASEMPELAAFLKTDDFGALASRTDAPAVIVAIVEEDGSGSRSDDILVVDQMNRRFSLVQIVSPFSTMVVPDHGFAQIADWISQQSILMMRRPQSADR